MTTSGDGPSTTLRHLRRPQYTAPQESHLASFHVNYLIMRRLRIVSLYLLSIKELISVIPSNENVGRLSRFVRKYNRCARL